MISPQPRRPPPAGNTMDARHSFPSARLSVFVAATVLTWSLTSSVSFGQVTSWPNWMGPNHDGVSTESGWSARWGDKGLPTIWQREIGIGFSSVSIADGRLFTMGHEDGVETVFCLDDKTGEVIWRHDYPSKLVANLYEGGPGATPTIDENRVYTLGKEGQLFCFQANDGEILWQKDLQEDLDVTLPEWGFNSSPRILDDHVIMEGGRVVCYQKFTGEKKWQSDRHIPGYGCVRPLQSEGQRLLAVLDCEALRILREQDGSQVDAFPWKSPFRTNSTTPIIHDGTIFISTAYSVGSGLFRLKEGTLELVYDNRKMRNHFNNSILYEGFLYGFDGNSNHGRTIYLKCMNHATGEIVWQHDGLGCGSLMVADGKLIVLSDRGKLVVAEARPDGFEPLSETQILEGRCWTVPVLLHGHVYARNAQGRLVCVRLPR